MTSPTLREVAAQLREDAEDCWGIRRKMNLKAAAIHLDLAAEELESPDRDETLRAILLHDFWPVYETDFNTEAKGWGWYHRRKEVHDTLIPGCPAELPPWPDECHDLLMKLEARDAD